MIVFSSILAALAAQAGPPSISVPDAIAPQWERYLLCVQGETMGKSRVLPSDAAIFEERLQEGVAKCAELRTRLTTEANEAMQSEPAYADPEVRAAAIEKALDGVIEGQRGLSRMVYSETNQSGDAQPTARPIDRAPVASVASPSYPYEIKDQVDEYLSCLTMDGQMRPFENGVSNEEQATQDLARCKRGREQAEKASVKILSKERSKKRVKELVGEFYDRLDAWHVSQARTIDEYIEGFEADGDEVEK